MSEEFLDIVNEQDVVIDVATRAEAYEKKLWHRIVRVFIFDIEGNMLLRKASKDAKFFPGSWMVPVGGHVQSAETYEQAAKREYEEELGTTAELEFLNKDVYRMPDGPKKFIASYKAQASPDMKPNMHDIEKIEFLSIERIKELYDEGEEFHPELLFLLKKYFF